MNAKGVRESGRVKIAISMPETLFDKINKRAAADGVSFNKIAVDLLACGLLDIEESEMYDEPSGLSGALLGDAK